MNKLRLLGIVSVMSLCLTTNNVAQQLGPCADQGIWSQPIAFTPGGNIDIPLLLTDGRVMVQYTGGGSGSGNPYQDWWALTPSSNGDYASGSWAPLDSFRGLWSPEWAPSAFASAVLANGDVIVQGGEWKYSGGTLLLSESTDGAVYGRTSKRWSRLVPPTQWPYIGDAPSVVLANKTYMVGACGSGTCADDQQSNYLARQGALLSTDYSSWTLLMNNGKLTPNAEEGWTLLPGGQVLTVAVSGSVFTCNGQPNTQYISEIFDPTSGTWSCAGSTIQQLYGDIPGKGEVGPALLLPPTVTNPSGSILATGASPSNNNKCSSQDQYQAHSAIYDVASRTWSRGPTFPCAISGNRNDPIGMGDRSAVLLPDGNAFLAALDLYWNSYFYEYTAAGTGGSNLCQITGAPLGLNTPGAGVRALLLPTGQVFITYQNANSYSYIYTPSQEYHPQTAWKPIITTFPSPIFSSTTYTIYGYQFNGMSQANMFGDEYQNATNYPLVRVTDSQGNVFYAQTHDHNTMGVATGVGSLSKQTWTQFDVPPGLAPGLGSLVVVANGIPSASVQVCINQSQC